MNGGVVGGRRREDDALKVKGSPRWWPSWRRQDKVKAREDETPHTHPHPCELCHPRWWDGLRKLSSPAHQAQRGETTRARDDLRTFARRCVPIGWRAASPKRKKCRAKKKNPWRRETKILLRR